MTASIIQAALSGRRAVILDWDGTLADTQERNYQALCAALVPYRTVIHRDCYREHAGLPIRDLIALLPASARLPLDEIVSNSRASLLAATTSGTLAAIPATADLARHAYTAGIPCAVASGATAELVETGLDVLELRHLFQAVVTRTDVAHGKPAPDTFLEAARRLNVAPEHCLAVEDAPDGITAAQRAGMRVLLVDNGELTWPAATDTSSMRQPCLLP